MYLSPPFPLCQCRGCKIRNSFTIGAPERPVCLRITENLLRFLKNPLKFLKNVPDFTPSPHWKVKCFFKIFGFHV